MIITKGAIFAPFLAQKRAGMKIPAQNSVIKLTLNYAL